jgi:hypothetical protein
MKAMATNLKQLGTVFKYLKKKDMIWIDIVFTPKKLLRF